MTLGVNMTTNEFDKLDQTCKTLLLQISNSLDGKEKIKLKKEFHQTKLKMISILDTEKESNGVIARELIRREENKKPIPRYETGIAGLDQAFRRGIEVGTFIQLAGQSFAGKTHLTLEILSNVAGVHGAVFFNFEMGEKRIARRLKKLLTTDEQLDNLIVDSYTRDIDDLIIETRIYSKKGIRFFAIDSKIKITSKQNSEEIKRYAEISSKLARVCQENDIIVFLINQMNEADQQSERLAFKGSGDQMYETDIALFYMVDKEEKRTLVCSKNRRDEQGFRLITELTDWGTTLCYKKGTIPVEVTEYRVDDIETLF